MSRIPELTPSRKTPEDGSPSPADSPTSSHLASLRFSAWSMVGLGAVAAPGGAFGLWQLTHLPTDAASFPPVTIALLAVSALAFVLAAVVAALTLRTALALADSFETAGRSRTGSERLAIRLLDGTSETLAVLDRDGVILAINETGARRLGFSPDEIAGRCVYDLMPEDVARSRRTRVEHVLHTGNTEVFLDTRAGRINENTLALLSNEQGEIVGVSVFARDVTEVQRAEEELRLSEERYRAVVEASPLGIAMVNIEGRRIIEANPSLCRMLGYEKHELVRLTVDDITHPEDLELDLRGEAAAREGNLEPRAYEKRYLRKDGMVVWGALNSTVVEDPEGRPSSVLGFVLDITERKQAEQDMRDHLRFLQTLLDVIPSAIFYKDREGTYQGCNQVLCEWVGLSRDVIVGKTVRDLYPRELADRYQEMDDRLFREAGQQMYEFRLAHTDGSEREVLFQKATYTDSEGRVAGLVGVATDIVQLKNEERALARERQRFFSVLEAIPAFVYLQGPDHTIRFANQEFHRLFGDPDGRPCYEVLHGRSEPCEPCSTFRVLETGTIERWEWTSPAGRTYTIHDVPFSDVDGFPLVLEVGLDITERKQAEEMRRELEEQLRHAQKMEAIGTLSTGVAHDFNNALMVVIGYAENARLAWPDRDRMDLAVEGILAAANQAAGVTRSLLTFSRKTTPHMAPVHLGQVVNEAVRMLRRMLPAAVELTVDASTTDPLWMEGDVVQLNQVLMNLVLNARDSMQDGGALRITVEGVPHDGAGQNAPDGGGGQQGRVRLCVEDTGSGMAQDVLDRVCEPFFTTKTREQGTGLGMAVVHGIVEGHRAQMRIRSRPGQGTTVTLEFPGCAPPGKDPEPRERAMPSAARGTVLLAEDHEQVRAVTTAALETAGHEVIAAADGEQALALFEEKLGAIDLAILDVDLPRLGGMACLEHVRAQRPDLPVILVSGYHEAPEAVRRHAGVRFLRKPFPLADMVSLVSDLLTETGSKSATTSRPS